MKNIQRIILSKYYLAFLFLASTAYLQAQRTPYVSGDLTIATDTDVPSDVATITTITGTLSISGTITEFPDFRDLEVVEGSLTIDNITTTGLITLTDIFPALDSVRGNLFIVSNEFVQTISGFADLDSVGGNLSIGMLTGPLGSPEVSNAALTTIPTFSVLKKIGGLQCISNPLLTALPPFVALKSTGIISIGFNPKVTTISGFGALTTVGTAIIIGGISR